MAFSFNRTDFIETRDYNEVEHSKALQHGIVDFVGDGLDITGTTITNGRGINNGVPFIIGRDGETESVSGFTGFLYVKTVLNKLNSISSFEKETVEQTSTDTVKWFKIYDMTSGVVDQDYRHINYVKDFSILPTGNPDEIKFSLNGFETEPFNVSVLAGQQRIPGLAEIGYDDSTQAGLKSDVIMYNIRQLANAINTPLLIDDVISDVSYPNLQLAFENDTRIGYSNTHLIVNSATLQGQGDLIKIVDSFGSNSYVEFIGDTYVNPPVNYGNYMRETNPIYRVKLTEGIDGSSYLHNGQIVNLTPHPYLLPDDFEGYTMIFSDYDTGVGPNDFHYQQYTETYLATTDFDVITSFVSTGTPVHTGDGDIGLYYKMWNLNNDWTISGLTEDIIPSKDVALREVIFFGVNKLPRNVINRTKVFASSHETTQHNKNNINEFNENYLQNEEINAENR